MLVRAPRERLSALDRALWTFVEREFLPHLRFAAPGARPAQAARTPIWLVDGEVPQGVPGMPAVLVNLGAAMVPEPGAFERIIEIVGPEPDDQAAGRERWRAYKAAGLEPAHRGR
ncbi:MAG: DNA polymerase III subunit chi [Rubrivivax sp.]